MKLLLLFISRRSFSLFGLCSLLCVGVFLNSRCLAGELRVPQNDGDIVNMTVPWSISPMNSTDPSPSEGGTLTFKKYFVDLEYGNGAPATGSGQGAFSYDFDLQSMTMAFDNYKVIIEPPALTCSVTDTQQPDISTNVRVWPAGTSMTPTSATTALDGSGSGSLSWSKGTTGVSILGNPDSQQFGFGAPPLHTSLTPSVPGGGSIWVRGTARPGDYTVSIPLRCISYANSGGVSHQIKSLATTATMSFTLLPRLTTCSVTPPGTIDFGNVFAGSSTTLIARRTARVSASCDVGQGSDDIGKGMYLTFTPGGHGLYGDDNKKLATSMSGIYITGGSDATLSSCGSSDMSFDGLATQSYRLKNLAQGTNQATKDLYFALCHDTAKPVQAGSLESDANVNVVIQ